MAGLYPDNETISLFGEDINWPGVDPDTGKFTNGDFSNPLKKPSFIPAETINLILDNLENLITSIGGIPNNIDNTQVKNAVKLASYPPGAVYESVDLTSPAELFGGTWSVFGAGRVLVGIDTADTDFDEVEKPGGAKTHELTSAQMPRHKHDQALHTHGLSGHSHSIDIWFATGTGETRPYYIKGSDGGNRSTNSTLLTLGQSGADIQYTGGVGSTQSASNGDAHNNLQPYTVVYRWKRTA